MRIWEPGFPPGRSPSPYVVARGQDTLLGRGGGRVAPSV